MKYYSAIIFLFVFSFFTAILLLYVSNLSRNIEKENSDLLKEINIIEDQININEIEYTLHNNYEYLKKLQKIYFDVKDDVDFDQRISFYNLENKNLENFHTVGIK